MSNKKRIPRIFIISGPSGVGKTTLLTKVLKKDNMNKHFIESISATTRKKRKGEVDGKDYLFMEKEDFVEKKNKGFFLEWEKVIDCYYGTPKYFLERAEKQKKDLILCIDVKGAMHLKKQFKCDTITTIFIKAPNKKDLKERLENRKENKESIKKRVALAEKEMKYIDKYDYVVVNDELKEAVNLLESILIVERIRRR